MKYREIHLPAKIGSITPAQAQAAFDTHHGGSMIDGIANTRRSRSVKRPKYHVWLSFRSEADAKRFARWYGQSGRSAYLETLNG